MAISNFANVFGNVNPEYAAYQKARRDIEASVIKDEARVYINKQLARFRALDKMTVGEADIVMSFIADLDAELQKRTKHVHAQ